MKYIKTLALSILVTASTVNAGWMDTLGDGFKMAQESGLLNTQDKTEVQSATKNVSTDVSVTDMNSALKKALSTGVTYALDALGKKDGYLNNEFTKIALPENLQKTVKLLRSIGGDKYVDDLVLALNNAATQAAPKTAAILRRALVI